MKTNTVLGVLTLSLLSACASVPTYSTLDMLPPSGKTWQQFSGEKSFCEGQASQQVQHEVSRRNTNGLIGGVATTILGAGIGAAAGGGAGAGIGAATGAFAGTAGGAMYSGSNSDSIQSAYNTVYLQCMQTYGNSIVATPRVMPTMMTPSRPVYNGYGYNSGYPQGYGANMNNMNGQMWNTPRYGNSY